MDECIFCKIVSGAIPAEKVKETEHVIVVKDIYPKAPIHLLVIPKKHVTDITGFKDEHRDAIWETLTVARDLASEIPNVNGFNFVSNNGASAGQSVFHFHWHFLSGRGLGEIAKEGL